MKHESPVGIADLSAILKLPVRWLKAEALQGRIPHLRVGRRLLFDVQAVQRALAARARGEGVRDGR